MYLILTAITIVRCIWKVCLRGGQLGKVKELDIVLDQCQRVNGQLVSYLWDYFLMCKRHIGALALQISDPIQKIVGGGNQKDMTTG